MEVCVMYIVRVLEEFYKQCGGVSVVTIETTLNGWPRFNRFWAPGHHKTYV